MANIFELFKSLLRKKNIVYPSFPIDEKQVVDMSSQNIQFEKDKVYFEMRVNEHFLKNKREYWQEWNPLTVVLNRFIFDGERRTFPFVVGPEMLSSIEQLEGKDSVRYSNTRVVGPTPYRGDQIALFIGLFRIESKNWGKQALNLLESVAKSFDSSKLSDYIKIAEPLVEGIEGFLGMGDKTQLRMGQRDEFGDPATPGGSKLKPGYFVMIRDDSNTKITDEYKKKFWVKDNQLFYGDNKSNIELYTENDYVLYQISCYENRNDYSTFEFHKQWKVVKDAIWKDSPEKIQEEYQQLILLIRRSPDLIPDHMKKLQLIYRSKAIEEYEAKKRANEPFFSLDNLNVNSFNRSINDLNRLSVPKKTLDALTMSNDFLSGNIKKRSENRRSLEFTEMEIREALDSDCFDNNLLSTLKVDKLNYILDIETPFAVNQ